MSGQGYSRTSPTVQGPYQSGALIVFSTNCLSIARVRRLTARRVAPSFPEKNSSLYESKDIGVPNLRIQ